MERKLTAILCADVYGYSRLMGEDEEATIRNLSAHRRTIDRLIEQHHGRFVNSAGDSVLAEFASAVNAVECAVEIQTALKTENVEVSPGRRMEFRMGVNLGDVVVEGGEIYGDGVNVAARLESLAEPGSIYISASVHEQIGNKLALGCEDLGEQHVKNIAKPVRVFRVLPNGTAPMSRDRRLTPRRYWRRGLLSLAGLAIALTTFVLVQHLSLKPPHTHASIPPVPSPALTLPDKPSIAVLPFANMSGDHEREYFSDGITTDLITDLSRLPSLFVIARNSTFTYKGKPTKLQDVSKELGVKYVLEGGVRKAGDQMRITVQLADATTGTELWAERYDRPLRDVFALQDEIVRRIVTTLNLQLTLAQRGVLIPRSTENLEAYDDLLRGMEYLLDGTKNGNVKARLMLEKAIELDANYAEAYVLLGWDFLLGYMFAFDSGPNGLEEALKMEQRAVALDDSLAGPHSLLAVIYVQNAQNDEALSEAQRGIALDPNSAYGYSSLAEVLNNQVKPTEALVAAEKAMRLDPRNPENYVLEQGFAYSLLGRWKEAIPAWKRILARFPDHIWAHAFLADAYGSLGEGEAAREQVEHVQRAVASSPNSALGYVALARVLNAQGRAAEALLAVKKATLLDPHPDLLLAELGHTDTLLGRPKEAIPALQRYLARNPDNFWAHAYLATDYMALGHSDAAGAEAAEALRLNPQLTVESVFPVDGLQRKALPAEIDRFRADLYKAGLE
jgi:TolB-like protein/class 3 adenylate cyclase/cytochrome c-type biogenesis protein CcmH/NrfG